VIDIAPYVGIPYLNRGRNMFGIDCWGIVRLIYKDALNITLGTLDGYADSESKDQVSRVIKSESAAHWEEVDAPREYDVVVFNLAGKPCHVGLMLDGYKFIHSLAGRDTCIESISKVIWRNRIDSIWRHNLCQS